MFCIIYGGKYFDRSMMSHNPLLSGANGRSRYGQSFNLCLEKEETDFNYIYKELHQMQ